MSHTDFGQSDLAPLAAAGDAESVEAQARLLSSHQRVINIAFSCILAAFRYWAGALTSGGAWLVTGRCVLGTEIG
jgi:hypothetical protein